MLSKQQTALWKKWIKALESGKYRQAQGALCKIDKSRGDAYCCLGVACDLVTKEVKGVWGNGDAYSEERSFTSPSVTGEPDTSSGMLTKAVVKLFGFESVSGFTVTTNGKHCDIAGINDDKRSRKGPFSNVLPHIKKYLEENQYYEPKKSSKSNKSNKGVKK